MKHVYICDLYYVVLNIMNQFLKKYAEVYIEETAKIVPISYRSTVEYLRNYFGFQKGLNVYYMIDVHELRLQKYILQFQFLSDCSMKMRRFKIKLSNENLS